ncbi:unnamed protein product, partial [Callosobruchus maculatus]
MQSTIKFVSLILLIILCPNSGCRQDKYNPFSTEDHIAALVLARGGSKGIKLKNLSHIGNQTLLEISLGVLKQVKGLDSIWVSTDHTRIAETAENENVNIHWRSAESATDTASSLFAVQEFLKYHPEVNKIGLIQCTSPFIKPHYIQRAVSFMRNDQECVFSVSRSYKLRWIEKDQKVVPLNFDPQKRPRRQEFKGELVENGMFYFTTRNLIEQGVLQSSNCKIVEIPPYEDL